MRRTVSLPDIVPRLGVWGRSAVYLRSSLLSLSVRELCADFWSHPTTIAHLPRRRRDSPQPSDRQYRSGCVVVKSQAVMALYCYAEDFAVFLTAFY